MNSLTSFVISRAAFLALRLVPLTRSSSNPICKHPSLRGSIKD
jgi:hypothetical protein